MFVVWLFLFFLLVFHDEIGAHFQSVFEPIVDLLVKFTIFTSKPIKFKRRVKKKESNPTFDDLYDKLNKEQLEAHKKELEYFDSLLQPTPISLLEKKREANSVARELFAKIVPPHYRITHYKGNKVINITNDEENRCVIIHTKDGIHVVSKYEFDYVLNKQRGVNYEFGN